MTLQADHPYVFYVLLVLFADSPATYRAHVAYGTGSAQGLLTAHTDCAELGFRMNQMMTGWRIRKRSDGQLFQAFFIDDRPFALLDDRSAVLKRSSQNDYFS
jgi:hypothetical protein